MPNIMDAIKLITDAGAEARVSRLKSKRHGYAIMAMLESVAIVEVFALHDGAIHSDALRELDIDLKDPKTWASSGVTMPAPESI